MKNFLANFILDDAKAIPTKIDFSEIKNKKILITGASGLVGHYLTTAFSLASRAGHLPTKLFLVSKNKLPDYFSLLCKEAPVEFLQGDLTDEKFLADLPVVDYIIHAGGYAQPGKFMNNPIETLKLNILTTFKLLEKLNLNGKFLFISSSEVYSGLKNPPFREDQIGTTNTDHSRACYIEGKRGGEAIVNAYSQKGIEAKSVRLSLVYGPGTKRDDTRVLNSFIKKAVLDKRISLLDKGIANRTYIYITDAVEIMLTVLFFGKSTIYNIGGTSRMTIGALAQTIGERLNVPVDFPADSNNAVGGAPEDVSLDMSKVQKEFNKKDFVSLNEGLEKTITWQTELYLKNN